jgi:3-phytase
VYITQLFNHGAVKVILAKWRSTLLACCFIGALFAVILVIWLASAPAGFSITVAAVVQTPSMAGSGDVADDPAIWVHPTDTSLSVVFGTSKHREQGGLYAYTLDGEVLGKYASGKALNNTDLRYGFPLGNELVDLIGATSRTDKSLVFFRIDAMTRQLMEVGSVTVNLKEPYGFCMYKSPVDGSFYAIGTDRLGKVEQYKLDGSSGSVTGQMVRQIDVGSTAEGCVADEWHRVLYVGEEDVGVWKYGAEPQSGSTRTKIDDVTGNLAADIEGLTIYRTSNGNGYIIVSSQGNSTFQVYDRSSHVHLGQFRTYFPDAGQVVETDGIAVTSTSLGGRFPYGVFVAHDSTNFAGATSNLS